MNEFVASKTVVTWTVNIIKSSHLLPLFSSLIKEYCSRRIQSASLQPFPFMRQRRTLTLFFFFCCYCCTDSLSTPGPRPISSVMNQWKSLGAAEEQSERQFANQLPHCLIEVHGMEKKTTVCWCAHNNYTFCQKIGEISSFLSWV